MLTRDESTAVWALGTAASVLVAPWMTLLVLPRIVDLPEDSDPGWALWAIFLGWILAGALGVAGVVAGGRVRRIGAAILVGGVFGVVLFVISVALMYSLQGGGD